MSSGHPLDIVRGGRKISYQPINYYYEHKGRVNELTDILGSGPEIKGSQNLLMVMGHNNLPKSFEHWSG